MFLSEVAVAWILSSAHGQNRLRDMIQAAGLHYLEMTEERATRIALAEFPAAFGRARYSSYPSRVQV